MQICLALSASLAECPSPMSGAFLVMIQLLLCPPLVEGEVSLTEERFPSTSWHLSSPPNLVRDNSLSRRCMNEGTSCDFPLPGWLMASVWTILFNLQEKRHIPVLSTFDLCWLVQHGKDTIIVLQVHCPLRGTPWSHCWEKDPPWSGFYRQWPQGSSSGLFKN